RRGVLDCRAGSALARRAEPADGRARLLRLHGRLFERRDRRAGALMASGASSADVVVVGGGIIGCASAYHLARRGVRVLLLDKGRIGHEQSSRNMGAVRDVPQGLLGGRDRTVQLVRETAHGVAAVERTRTT